MGQTPRPAADSAVRIGQVFLGKYKVESILGQGGMGVVAECTHLQLNERVAIKMLRPDVVIDADAVERFMREAQAVVKLKSEYVARVSDVGSLENGTPYMVMEFLEGEDLGKLLEERGHLPVAWSTELMLQTAEALAEAHSIGIVHRDIKPANLFVTWRPDGTSLIKVLDFGISKIAMGPDMQLTQTQSLLGTPAYMSPEQMRSARLVDARTDLWSLGSVLYELLEGRKPFEADSFSEMCVKVAVDAPAPMTRTPVELQPVILRCLAKSPEQRYASMAEFGRELVPFSPDPHQASLLVERMQRMLRRGEPGGWEGSTTGVGMRGVPNHVRDPASAPSRQWDARSDALGRAWHPGSDPAGSAFRNTPLPNQGVPMVQPRERSAPAHAHSEMLVAAAPPRSRKKLAFVAVAVVLLGAGIGAVALTSVTDSGGQQGRVPVKQAVTVEVAPTPTAVEVKPTPVLTPDVVTEEPKVDPKPTGEAKTTAKPLKKSGKSTKAIKASDKAAEAAKVAPPIVEQKKCNVWENAHDCNKRK